MDKEKEIRKMAQMMCDDCCHNCEDFKCAIKIYAEELYNAGYRNAADVRKETALEVLNEVGELYIGCGENGMYLKDTEIFKLWCIHFGFKKKLCFEADE